MPHHHKFSPRMLERLRNPERMKRENPEIIWKNFALQNPECIIDIGAGIGFAAIPLAKKMPQGTVWACDINTEMLEELKKEIDKEGIPNVKPLLTGEIDVTLPDSIADGILMQNMHHELRYPDRSMKECRRLLKPGGKLAILDWKKEETPGGPPIEIRVTSEDMEKDVLNAGFTNITRFHNLPYHTFIVCTNPD